MWLSVKDPYISFLGAHKVGILVSRIIHVSVCVSAYDFKSPAYFPAHVPYHSRADTALYNNWLAIPKDLPASSSSKLGW